MNGEIYIYSAIAIGVIAILSVLYVFIRGKKVPISGMAVLLAGVVLFGLPIWSSAEFSMDGDGFRFNFSTINDRLKNIETELIDNSESVRSVKDEIAQVANNVELVKTANYRSSALIAQSFQSSNLNNSAVPQVYENLASQILASRELNSSEQAEVADLIESTEVRTRNLNAVFARRAAEAQTGAVD